MAFGVWDYVVFIFMLCISAGIGVYFRFTGGKQKTTDEYLLADRSMSIWPVSTSLMASFMSAITLLGVSMENYQFGMIFIVINISYGLATPIAAYLYLPVFFKLQAASAYEYLERRFGRATRLCASLAYTTQMVLYMGIVLYAPAIALEAVTGMKKELAIIAIGVVCTFYSTIGGMKAVLITDVFQAILMFASVYLIIIYAAVQAKGVDVIWNTAVEGGRINFLNFSPDPTERHTWWSLIIGGGFTYLTLYAVNQTQVQRLLTVNSLKKSQTALWLNWPILSLLSLSTSFCGLSLYYFYRTCDPLIQGRLSSRDQLMPLFIVDAMSHLPGVPGLFVSGIFSASLSTVSASLNSLAAVTLEDYIKPLYLHFKKQPMPAATSTLPTKITACLYGVVCVAVAFIAQFLGGVLQASLTIFGVVGGPLFGLFTLGMFTTRGNQRGAISGLTLGLVVSLWIGFGQPKEPLKMLDFSTEDCSAFNGNITTGSHLPLMYPTLPSPSQLIKSAADTATDEPHYFYLYRISYMWYVVIGFLVSFVSGYLISWLLESFDKAGEVKIYTDSSRSFYNTDLFSPPVARYLKRQMAKRIESSGNNFTNAINHNEAFVQHTNGSNKKDSTGF